MKATQVLLLAVGMILAGSVHEAVTAQTAGRSVSAPASGPTSQPVSQRSANPADDQYRAKAGTVISFFIEGLYPEFYSTASWTTQVPPAGTITLPKLSDPLKVDGMTAQEVLDAVTTAYAAAKVVPENAAMAVNLLGRPADLPQDFDQHRLEDGDTFMPSVIRDPQRWQKGDGRGVSSYVVEAGKAEVSLFFPPPSATKTVVSLAGMTASQAAASVAKAFDDAGDDTCKYASVSLLATKSLAHAYRLRPADMVSILVEDTTVLNSTNYAQLVDQDGKIRIMTLPRPKAQELADPSKTWVQVKVEGLTDSEAAAAIHKTLEGFENPKVTVTIYEHEGKSQFRAQRGTLTFRAASQPSAASAPASQPADF